MPPSVSARRSGGGQDLAGRRTRCRPIMVRILTAALAAVALAVVPVPPAHAQADFGVSAPADPIATAAGAVVDTSIAISNNAREAATFAIEQVTLEPGDDGRLRTVDDPDDIWAGNVNFPPNVEVGPGERKQIPVRIRVPASLQPDLYFVGFAVGPAAAAVPGRVIVRNRVSTFVVVEIPGKRDARVRVTRHQAPGFLVGREIRGHYRVENAGRNNLRFRSQVRIDSRDGENLAVINATDEGMLLLPAGTHRRLTYEWAMSGLIRLVQPNIEVTYPDGPKLAAVTQRGPTVVVVAPEVLAAAAGLLLLLAGLLVRRRVRRHRARAAA